MPTKRLRLEGASLSELTERVLIEHGPRAKIVAAEKVTVGGVRGYFARKHYEVTVELPERPRRGAHAADVPAADLPATPAGLAALLEQADHLEAELRMPAAAVSTGSRDFAALMDDLTFNTGAGAGEPYPPRAAPPETAEPVPLLTPAPAVAHATAAGPAPAGPAPAGPSPALAALLAAASASDSIPVFASGVPGAAGSASPASALPASAGSAAADSATVAPTRQRPVPILFRAPGDLVVVAGLRGDALEVARAMATELGAAHVYPGGASAAPAAHRVDDRRSALNARARGVESGSCVLAAVELGSSPAEVRRYAADVHAMGADQVWVAVDAGRKPEDTARWVSALARATTVHALAVVDSFGTSSPETVNELGLPLGWVDGAPAKRATL